MNFIHYLDHTTTQIHNKYDLIENYTVIDKYSLFTACYVVLNYISLLKVPKYEMAKFDRISLFPKKFPGAKI